MGRIFLPVIISFNLLQISLNIGTVRCKNMDHRVYLFIHEFLYQPGMKMPGIKDHEFYFSGLAGKFLLSHFIGSFTTGRHNH